MCLDPNCLMSWCSCPSLCTLLPSSWASLRQLLNNRVCQNWRDITSVTAFHEIVTFLLSPCCAHFNEASGHVSDKELGTASPAQSSLGTPKNWGSQSNRPWESEPYQQSSILRLSPSPGEHSDETPTLADTLMAASTETLKQRTQEILP